MKNQRQVLRLFKDGLFSVTQDGQVYNHKMNRILAGYKDGSGYIQQELHAHPLPPLYVKTHQLVWLFFRGSIPSGLQINHKDGVKTNNTLCNLELVTPAENIQHAFKIGLRSSSRDKHNGKKLSVELVLELRRIYALGGTSYSKLAETHGVHTSTIAKAISGKNWGVL